MPVREFKRHPILVFRGRLAAEASIAHCVTGASDYRALSQLVAADGVDERFLNERVDKIAKFDDLLISMSGNRHDGSPIRVISDKEFGE